MERGNRDRGKRPGGRLEREKRVVELMIRLYCRRREGNARLCPGCARLLEYSLARLDACKFGPAKPTCKRCPVHCYRPDMRARVRQVMRFAGPRMLLYHPAEALRHLADAIRSR